MDLTKSRKDNQLPTQNNEETSREQPYLDTAQMELIITNWKFKPQIWTLELRQLLFTICAI